MLRTLTSRLLYTVAVLMLLGAMAHGFFTAIRLRRVTPANVCEFVSSRHLPHSEASTDTWLYDGNSVHVEGLGKLEYNFPRMDLEQWRHGLAPATTLTFSPHNHPVTVAWDIVNKQLNQRLIIKLGATILRAEAITSGLSSGQIELKPTLEPTTLRLEFSQSTHPPKDTRTITVTFRTLRVAYP